MTNDIATMTAVEQFVANVRASKIGGGVAPDLSARFATQTGLFYLYWTVGAWAWMASEGTSAKG